MVQMRPTDRTLSVVEGQLHNSDEDDSNQVELTLFTDILEAHDPKSTWNFFHASHFSLSLRFEDSSASDRAVGVRMALAAFLGSGIPLGRDDEVIHVYLQSDVLEASIDPETLVSTIGGLPAVSFIASVGSMNSSLAGALQHQIIGHPDAETSYYFPKLGAISLSGKGLDEDTSNFDLVTLEDSLIRRNNLCNVRIRKLTLEQLDFMADEDLDNLRQIIGDVEFR